MDANNLLDVFDREMQCEYKGRKYLVRDNGAILRLPKEGARSSSLDNVWTFGKKNPVNGYMFFTGNVRVHQVVATAFHGAPADPNMVVDHIDTNRCNNRPENLRWLTRLENVLLNEATRAKIIYLCGSIEAFLDDPSMLRNMDLPQNIAWMRTVSKEEAAACKKRMQDLGSRPPKPQSTGKGIGDWIFSNEKEIAEAIRWNGFHDYSKYSPSLRQGNTGEELEQPDEEEEYRIIDSLTPGAKQRDWVTPTEFPLCPQEGQEHTLQAYLRNLVAGKVFTRNQYGEGVILEADKVYNEEALVVLTYSEQAYPKHWALCYITLENGYYVHEGTTYFEEQGGRKYFTLAIGKEWTGGDVFDDFC